MKYTDLCARAEKALEGVTEGEWLYRPNRHDDWGVVKVGDFHLCQIRDPNCYTTDQLNEARANKIDPWEANARFIAFARAWVPAAAAAIRELEADLDHIREQRNFTQRQVVFAEARVAELEGALLNIDALDPEQHIDGCSMGVIRGLVLRMGSIARTALSKIGETK